MSYSSKLFDLMQRCWIIGKKARNPKYRTQGTKKKRLINIE